MNSLRDGSHLTSSKVDATGFKIFVLNLKLFILNQPPRKVTLFSFYLKESRALFQTFENV